MLERGLPFAEKATPAASATSSHRPPPRFIHRWFGDVSFVTNRSRRPSLLKSVATTPSALPGALREAGRRAHVREAPAALVAEQEARQRVEDARHAEVALAVRVPLHEVGVSSP